MALALTLVLPFSAAILSLLRGPGWLGHAPVVPTDLDSHFRYLSGIFLAMLVLYATCIPNIERRGARLSLLVLLTVAGGLMRLLSLFIVGAPSEGHQIGLAMELGVAPALWLWQRRVAARRT